MALQNDHQINIHPWTIEFLNFDMLELLDESAYNILYTEVHSSLPIRSLDMKLAISRELVC